MNYELTMSDLYLLRGLSKYELKKYPDALEDFKGITDSGMNSIKHNNMGICYYELGLYEEARKSYFEAIRKDSYQVRSFYNLAILYHNEGDIKMSRKMLNSCLQIDRNFHEARVLLKELEKSRSVDWFSWWFRNGMAKKALGCILMIPLIMFIYWLGFTSMMEGTAIYIFGNSFMIKNVSSNGIGAAALSIASLLILLLLPNIEKLRIGNIELNVKSMLITESYASFESKPLPSALEFKTDDPSRPFVDINTRPPIG